MEQETKTCKGCGLDLPLSDFNKHSQTRDKLRSKCIECRRIEHIEYRKSNPEKIKATPSWLTESDKESMLELYTICGMFKIYTGFEYHVDHIVPLCGKTICGLHVPWNLRVSTALDNLSKNNKLDESLAIDLSAPAYC